MSEWKRRCSSCGAPIPEYQLRCTCSAALAGDAYAIDEETDAMVYDDEYMDFRDPDSGDRDV